MLYFAFAQAVLSKFELDRRVVEGGKFVVHGLHDFEAFGEIFNPVLRPPRVAPKVLRGSVGVLSVAFLLDLVDAPREVVVLELLGRRVEDDVFFVRLRTPPRLVSWQVASTASMTAFVRVGSQAMVWSSISHTSTTPPLGWMGS